MYFRTDYKFGYYTFTSNVGSVYFHGYAINAGSRFNDYNILILYTFIATSHTTR
ncbi:MAG: hypothetical protein LBQ76_08775 [Candidatus Fibromonas sp.]|nr:hypothetical protein [Candidatus Fibromonas sp.]